ncbi:hypothetical protein MVEN_00653500 [Mycena venus]|uniref:Uncharacterized protein n=1 Tax=Mycena venus TaxID=2733690 RepID=A0A8H6YPY9_9AGAR|nr:hypothetical protein MVEN_00653500 [Mycena venus]
MRSLLLQFFWTVSVAIASPWPDVVDSNQTLLTWEDGILPIGTYIATGVSGIIRLAEYLTIHPEATITHLLISDSTTEDVDTFYGYLSASFMWEESDWGLVEKKLTDKEKVRVEEVVCDTQAPLQRILDMAAPSLETLSFLTYIPELNSNLDCDGIAWKEDLRAAAILRRDYPSLHHLTLRLTELFRWADDDDDEPAHPLHYGLHFPSVTHLHTATLRQRGSPSLASHLHYFRNLTHRRISGITSSYQLPSDMIHTYRNPGLVDHFKENVLGIPYRYTVPLQPVPRNLTVIVQPGFDPMFDGGWCGTPGVEYDAIFQTLANRSQIYVKFPIEEDYQKYGNPRGIVPLRRAIMEFVDLVQGGDGDWTIPEPAGGGGVVVESAYERR